MDLALTGAARRPPEGAGVRFAGYASIFNRLDSGRDIVVPGAFQRTLGDAALRPLPLLWQHDPAQPIGLIEAMVEDRVGLRVIGALTTQAQRGADAAALLKAGALTGLSFGYRIRQADRTSQKGVRRLLDLDLLEVSLVTFPMQPAARVLALDPASSSTPKTLTTQPLTIRETIND